MIVVSGRTGIPTLEITEKSLDVRHANVVRPGNRRRNQFSALRKPVGQRISAPANIAGNPGPGSTTPTAPAVSKSTPSSFGSALSVRSLPLISTEGIAESSAPVAETSVSMLVGALAIPT